MEKILLLTLALLSAIPLPLLLCYVLVELRGKRRNASGNGDGA